MPRHPSGSQPPNPGSPIIRPASRAMSVSSATGNEGSGSNGMAGNHGGSGMINGTPATPITPMTPKHPGTPQMGGQGMGIHGGQGPQGLQNQHQGTPPPASPAMNGPSLKRKASGMGMPESPRMPSTPGTNIGSMGMGIGNMGPPSGVPSHQQNGIGMGMPGQQTPQKPGIGMGRPGSGMTGTPTVASASLPGSASGTQTPQTPQMPMSSQAAPSTPRQTSLPPGTPSQANQNLQGQFQNQNQSGHQDQDQNDNQTATAGGDTGMADGIGKPAVNGISTSSGPIGTAAASASPSTPSQAQLNGPVIPQLPPLPANVNLNAAVTKVTVVPLVGSDKAIPMLTPEEIENIKKWQAIDKEYDGIWKGMKDRMQNELRGEVFGKTSHKWWEKGSVAVNPGARFRRRMPPENFDVRYPGKGRRDHHHSRGKKVVKREGLKLPRRLKKEDANRPERLVPIRLEFDVDHYRMRDTFVWNLNDPIVTPEHFAQSLCEDYNLGQNYHSLIVRSIQDQLNDYKSHSPHYDAEGSEFSDVEESPEKGNLDGKNAAWWEFWRKRLRTEAGFVRSGKRNPFSTQRKVVKDEYEDDADVEMTDLEDERPMALEDFKLNEKEMTEDMRIVIKLDIIVGSMKLDDQFEWDLDNPTASPEQFAEVYAQDLGLGGEFKTAIAHAIREQVQTYQKSLYIVGRPSDNTPIQDEDLRSAFLPNLSEGARAIDQVQSFTPHLNYLSDGEIERNEKERDKDMNKRRKRNTRGRRGANLPDREPIRTHRTPAIGFPELDPATLALAAAANAPVSRRAAAAAASLTIANMVASENGMPLLPTNVPAAAPQPPPSAAKEKKTKGLFKAPPVPSSVLSSRARMTTRTSTTAADVSALPAPLDTDALPSISTPDSKATRVLSAKRVKELEREAKEKEFVDGQHSNWIDGVWHCSNCGCPDNIAVGRRKGPLGDKSQCGICGKYWHRHRRPRPVEYNTDPEFHMNAIKKENEPKSGAKKKTGALRGQNTVPSTPADLVSEPATPARRKDIDDMETPTRPSSPPASRRNDDDRAASPVSSVSSASEPPLSQRVKANGAPPVPHDRSLSPTEAVDVKEEPNTSEPPPASTATQSPPIAPASPTKSWPPQWLSSAMHSTQAKYPNDKFELALRKVSGNASPEWRIKCVDCPGKLYKPGPGETLSNFEVHLKNRQHRQRVDDRVNGDS
ncbi:hypothetical protein D9758_009401 [Tetrapyrgos nigripes]|uniref:SNF5-domain-containing protein n=1 Tax=Tetrapyrgos nigripes TaxID=182062 RepID=A0A8H5FX15_9AGAR|nr:hypothetical protein D9758_009401 [Tetrapyrgos nigripes]